MRIPILPLVILVAVSVCVDVYIDMVLTARCKKRWPSRVQEVMSVLLYGLLATGLFMPMREGSNSQLLDKMFVLFAFLTFLFPKILFTVIDIIAKIPRAFKRPRLKWLSMSGAILAVLTFIGMWWGALFNRYNIDVVEQPVEIENLPAGFDGYRIVQISDLHVGSYGSDTAFVSKLVNRINALNPDVILFTGDIVNRQTDELMPFVTTLSRLKARDGVYSILGNHDYGDYYNWPSATAKQANMQKLIDSQKQMGWNLLLNDHDWLRRGRDSLLLIGVENVGDPPFTVYGDLRQAYSEIGDYNVKILMTHNPVHWDMDLQNNPESNIALTLSGHTHAMQISAGRLLSPAAFRYKHWGGMYTDTLGQRLYVNIGAGVVGLPMRFGATPEVTVFTLRRK